jgi:hypothetical protein
VLRVTQRLGTPQGDVLAALRALSRALAGATLSVTLPLLPDVQRWHADRAAVMELCDYVVLTCLDAGLGGAAEAPNCGLGVLTDALRLLTPAGAFISSPIYSCLTLCTPHQPVVRFSPLGGFWG